NRCCQSSGLPPPATASTLLPTTSPDGRKKLVCATLSISCSTPAASSGGNASNRRKLVTNCAQTKNGIRKKWRPLVRSWMMVTMKFTEPSSDDVIRKIMPVSHIVWPLVAVMTESGGYDVQPDCAAPPGRKKLVSITQPPMKNTQ